MVTVLGGIMNTVRRTSGSLFAAAILTAVAIGRTIFAISVGFGIEIAGLLIFHLAPPESKKITQEVLPAFSFLIHCLFILIP